MQHYLRKFLWAPLSTCLVEINIWTLENVARIALAIDHDKNGYRSLLPMAMEEPALMNALLAVAASHHSRWQNVEDKMSAKYLEASTKALSQRFSQPELIGSPTTLACMLALTTFEVMPLRRRASTIDSHLTKTGILWIKSLDSSLQRNPGLD